MDRLACRCGWSVYRGLDCGFCGTPADDVIADAEIIAEVLDLRSA